MRGLMAINPQDIADENTQRSALAEKGSPTEFAEDPKQSIQLAGKLNKQSTMALLTAFGSRAIFEHWLSERSLHGHPWPTQQ